MTSNTHGVIDWGIDTGHGEAICQGLEATHEQAIVFAQLRATERGEPVYLYSITEDGDGESEEISPLASASPAASPRAR